MSKKTLFCNGWQFSKQPFGTFEYSENFDWKNVDIPHDYLIENTKNLYETSNGWYRKKFTYNKKADTLTSIRFEGVYQDCEVFVNGKSAGVWKYGYSTFELDITDLLKEGENLIAVRINYQSPNSRWYSGAGIYRKVWLKETPETHFLADGIYISTEGNTVTVSSEISKKKNESLFVKHIVKDKDGNAVGEVCSAASAADRSVIPAAVRKEGENYALSLQTIQVNSPEKWDIENPCLYTMISQLILDGQVIEEESCKFGFREIRFTTDKGFFLNGKHLKLRGSCEHHDLGALGAAQNRAAVVMRLKKLREMGINAIRTSHNMPSVELMECADEMGFLILSEGFDMWERAKTEFDYSRFFKEWAEKDVAAWVRRDRNHPSLIGWSIGNEIYDVHADERGQEINSMLAAFVRQHDTRHNGYVTSGSNYLEWENAQKCTDLFKLAGYNYGERLYKKHHEKHPDWMI
ncbi:MAG: glycoside hydrolase family 2, partial [Ruminiclostridium sp.]|nr:glycoside hydrolase family 2 [Ruminiclostridium sp.]